MYVLETGLFSCQQSFHPLHTTEASRLNQGVLSLGPQAVQRTPPDLHRTPDHPDLIKGTIQTMLLPALSALHILSKAVLH